MVVHDSDFMLLSTEDREFYQGSEDTQQHFSRARPRSIKVFLLSLYSRENMYQALISRSTVLQATGSWERAWE